RRCRASSTTTSPGPSPTATARCTRRWSVLRGAPWKCRSAPVRCMSRPSWAWPRTGATRRPAAAPRARAPAARPSASSRGGDGRDEGLAGALDAELVEERVYALTPKGEVVDLPQGSTPLDFAYHVHTMVGHRYRGAKVNGRIVPLGHRLRSGDRVEILTGKEPDPKRDWLLPANGYLASGRSRDKVRAWFHKLDRSRNVAAGREMLERELKRLGLHQA